MDTSGTRVLSVKGKDTIEVAEDELGTPVTTYMAATIPPRHTATVGVKVEGKVKKKTIISPNGKFMDSNPHVYQGEISINPIENEDCAWAVVNFINLDSTKTLRIPRGEVVGFAHDESVRVEYIETTKVLEHPDYIDCKPRNWIPRRNRSHRDSGAIDNQRKTTPEHISTKRTKEQHEHSKGSSPRKVEDLSEKHQTHQSAARQEHGTARKFGEFHIRQ